MVGGEIHLEVHGTYVDCGIFSDFEDISPK